MEALIKRAFFTTSKKGKKMIIGTMEQAGEDKEFLAFEPECLDFIAAVRENNLVDVRKTDEYQGKIVLKEVVLIKEGKSGLSEEEQNKRFDEIFAIIPDSMAALKNLWLENREAIKKAPAAAVHHHNYVGGLLQHLSELKKAAEILEPVFGRNVNMEIVCAGIALHDLAKIWEYTNENGVRGINQEWQKQNLSHVHWAFAWAINQKQFDLAHVVASHHGFVQWDALTEPESPEAHFLFIADMLSARLGKKTLQDI